MMRRVEPIYTDRQIVEILQYLLDFFANYGYLAVFLVLVACGFGIPVPEDITLVAGGVICALSKTTPHLLDPNMMVLVSLIGVLLGDGTMFVLGNLLGPKITRIPLIRKIITVNNYAKIQEKAHRYGNKVLFIARFLPGLRAPIFLTAGMSHKVQLWKFLLMDGSAALISVPLWVYLGYLFANDLDLVIKWVRHSEILILITIISLLLCVFIYKKLKNK